MSHHMYYTVKAVSKLTSVTPLPRYTVTNLSVTKLLFWALHNRRIERYIELSVTPLPRYTVTPLPCYTVTPLPRYTVTPLPRYTVTSVHSSVNDVIYFMCLKQFAYE